MISEKLYQALRRLAHAQGLEIDALNRRNSDLCHAENERYVAKEYARSLEQRIEHYKDQIAQQAATLADLEGQLRHARSEGEFYKGEFERTAEKTLAPERECGRLLSENEALKRDLVRIKSAKDEFSATVYRENEALRAQVAELEGLLPEVDKLGEGIYGYSPLVPGKVYEYQQRKKEARQ